MINVIDQAEDEDQGSNTDQAPQQIIRPWDECDAQSCESGEKRYPTEEGRCTLMPAIGAWFGHPAVLSAYLDREQNECSSHGKG